MAYNSMIRNGLGCKIPPPLMPSVLRQACLLCAGIDPYFNCSDWRGVTMPSFEKFYLVWNQWVGSDFGRSGG